MLKVKFILAFFILLIPFNNKAYAEMYKWTDENGVVNFSDSVPYGTETQPRVEQLPMETVEYYREELDSSDTDKSDYYDHFSGGTLYRVAYKYTDKKYEKLIKRLEDALIDHLHQDRFSRVSVNDIDTFDYWHEKVTQEIVSSDRASVYFGGPSGFRPVYVVFTYNDDGEKNKIDAFTICYYSGQEQEVQEKSKDCSEYSRELYSWVAKKRKEIAKSLNKKKD